MHTHTGLTLDAHARDEVDEIHDAIPRPRTRGDCVDQPRPCPWVGCRYHLYLDINPHTGSVKFRFPDLDPWDLEETCALDLAERGPMILDDIGKKMNLNRERIRQIEARGLVALAGEKLRLL